MTNNALGEEIMWLRGFGWSAIRIAKRLACNIRTVQDYIKLEDGDYSPSELELFEIASGARRESRLVYGRTVPEWRK